MNVRLLKKIGLMVGLFALPLLSLAEPASPSPKVKMPTWTVKLQGESSVEICAYDSELRFPQCISREMPKQVGTINFLTAGKLVSQFKPSWIVSNGKDVSICTLDNSAASTVCVGISTPKHSKDYSFYTDGETINFVYQGKERKAELGKLLEYSHSFATAAFKASRRLGKKANKSLPQSKSSAAAPVASLVAAGGGCDFDPFFEDYSCDGGGGWYPEDPPMPDPTSDPTPDLAPPLPPPSPETPPDPTSSVPANCTVAGPVVTCHAPPTQDPGTIPPAVPGPSLPPFTWPTLPNTCGMFGGTFCKLEDPVAEKQRCASVRADCRVNCTDSTLPTRDYSGDPFYRCLSECIASEGC